MGNDKKASKAQLLRMIDELESRPKDRVRILGDIGITSVGAGLGAAAASTVAGIVGATSIPVVTTAASWLGITALAATPVGWIIGTAAAAGGIAYGVSRLIHNGGLSEGRKNELLTVYQERLREVLSREQANAINSDDRSQFISSLREVIEKEAISPQKAFQLIDSVERGLIPLSKAYELISAILQEK
jgi:hypothetical protein